MDVQQVVPWDTWPSGDSMPVAIVPFGLSELAERYGLEWQTGIDDLGRYQLAAVELAQGAQAWLVRHDTDPNPGTVVYVDAGSDIAKAQSQLVQVLGIERRELLWSAPVLGHAPVARFG